jgi:hypothetical protein
MASSDLRSCSTSKPLSGTSTLPCAAAGHCPSAWSRWSNRLSSGLLLYNHEFKGKEKILSCSCKNPSRPGWANPLSQLCKNPSRPGWANPLSRLLVQPNPTQVATFPYPLADATNLAVPGCRPTLSWPLVPSLSYPGC